MGSAFTIPCLENNNRVVITEPYSKKFISDLSSKNKFHSALKVKLPKKLKFKKFSDDLFDEKFDLIVIALSLSGIDFIGKELENLRISNPILVLTKGLKYEKKDKKILVDNVLIATAEITKSFYPDSITDDFDFNVKDIKKTSYKNKVKFVFQNIPKGTGDAVLKTQKYIKNKKIKLLITMKILSY